MVVITMERAIVVAMDGDGGGYNYGGSRDSDGDSGDGGGEEEAALHLRSLGRLHSSSMQPGLLEPNAKP